MPCSNSLKEAGRKYASSGVIDYCFPADYSLNTRLAHRLAQILLLAPIQEDKFQLIETVPAAAIC